MMTSIHRQPWQHALAWVLWALCLALAAVLLWQGIIPLRPIWIVASFLLLVDATLLADPFGARRDVPILGSARPSLAVPAWALVLSLTAWTAAMVLIDEGVPHEVVRWCRAFAPTC